MPKNTTAPTSFRCTHCAYDLASLRTDTNEPVTCPECGQSVDPFNLRADKVRILNPWIAFLQVFFPAMLPSIFLASSLLTNPLTMSILAFFALILPAHITSCITERTIATQRRSIARAIGYAWGLGIFAGFFLLLIIADLFF